MIFSVDGDSDSMSECRGLSPLRSPSMNGGASSSISFLLNGSSKSFENHQSTSGQSSNIKRPNSNSKNQLIQTNGIHYVNSTGNSSSTHHYEQQNSSTCEANGANGKEYSNGYDKPNGSQGSPLRSQLGLNLKKSNSPASTAKKSPNLFQVILMF